MSVRHHFKTLFKKKIALTKKRVRNKVISSN